MRDLVPAGVRLVVRKNDRFAVNTPGTHHLVNLFHSQSKVGCLEAGGPERLQQEVVVQRAAEVVAAHLHGALWHGFALYQYSLLKYVGDCTEV